jgi:hypothetical protein
MTVSTRSLLTSRKCADSDNPFRLLIQKAALRHETVWVPLSKEASDQGDSGLSMLLVL